MENVQSMKMLTFHGQAHRIFHEFYINLALKSNIFHGQEN